MKNILFEQLNFFTINKMDQLVVHRKNIIYRLLYRFSKNALKQRIMFVPKIINANIIYLRKCTKKIYSKF